MATTAERREAHRRRERELYALLREEARSFEFPPTKNEAPCCNAHRDDLGRLPVGYCSSGCIRRPKR